MDDTYKIYSEEGRAVVCRKPISNKYFTEAVYVGERATTKPEEKLLAKFTNERVIARGEKGNVFFVDERKLKKGYKFNPSGKLPHIGDRLVEKMFNVTLDV